MSISNNQSLEREIFYNCTLPRFGSLCQYEINYVHKNYSSLYDMINDYYKERYFNPEVNCYTHLQCNRGPSPACLDWTEICDGQVDCIDDKVDEKDCWKIEIHVCQDDEFQCSNGQCIPMAFYHDDEINEDCADMTDEHSPQLRKSLRFIYKQPSFIIEENQFRSLPIGNLNFDEDENIALARTKLLFQHVCDGLTHLIPINNDKQNETECEQWPCNNIYTHCDGIWDCPKGEDETGRYSFTTLNCSSNQHLCVLPDTNQFTCIPLEKINDNNIDCLGATDEPTLCQKYDYAYNYRSFLCKNSSSQRCINLAHLCNGKFDCEYGDDEQFCMKRYKYGLSSSYYNVSHSEVEQFFYKELVTKSRSFIKHFSLDGLTELNTDNQTTSIRPSGIIRFPQEYELMMNRKNPCSRGIQLRVWFSEQNNSTTNICLCPPSYYGDHCQNQNQRVSLTMAFRVMSDSRSTLFAIIMSLIDDSEQRIIHSYEQLSYLSVRDCKAKFNVYLVYSNRPKSQTRNYS
ncbi:unnamed protein product, partial [Rotaria sordida]